MNKETIIEVEQEAKEYLNKLDNETGTVWTEDNENIIAAFVDFATAWAEKYLAEKDRADRLEKERIFFADYIQRCMIEVGQMTYPQFKEAIKVWDEIKNKFPETSHPLKP